MQPRGCSRSRGRRAGPAAEAEGPRVAVPVDRCQPACLTDVMRIDVMHADLIPAAAAGPDDGLQTEARFLVSVRGERVDLKGPDLRPVTGKVLLSVPDQPTIGLDQSAGGPRRVAGAANDRALRVRPKGALERVGEVQ